jgi:hypothetical protein
MMMTVSRTEVLVLNSNKIYKLDGNRSEFADMNYDSKRQMTRI